MTEQVEFERIDLKKFRLIVQTYIHEELLDDFAIHPMSDVREMAVGALMHQLFKVTITQEVYGEELGTLEIERPATWFQMLKEQHAPDWFKRRWPVRYDTETHDARALYPKLAMPDETNNRVWVRSYLSAHTEPKRS